MWKAEMRKALVSKRMCLIVGTIYMACWVGSFENMRIGTRNITQLCEELLTISAFKRVIPLISGMGFAMSYWEEYRYQYWYYSILRTKKKSYIGAKVLTNLVGSFGAAVLGMALFCITLGITPEYFAGQGIGEGFVGSYLENIQKSGNGVWLLTAHILSLGWYSATCAMIAMAISAVARGKYVVLLGPFLLLEGSNLFFQIYHVDKLHPNFVLQWKQSTAEQMRVMGICILIMAVCSGIFGFVCKRRME